MQNFSSARRENGKGKKTNNVARSMRKELKNLGRAELLELLVQQGEQLDATKEALAAAEERAANQERIARLAEEAVTRLHGIMEAASLAKEQYFIALGEVKAQMGIVANPENGNGEAAEEAGEAPGEVVSAPSGTFEEAPAPSATIQPLQMEQPEQPARTEPVSPSEQPAAQAPAASPYPYQAYQNAYADAASSGYSSGYTGTYGAYPNQAYQGSQGYQGYAYTNSYSAPAYAYGNTSAVADAGVKEAKSESVTAWGGDASYDPD